MHDARAAGVRAAGVLAPALAVSGSAVLAPVELTEAQLVALSAMRWKRRRPVRRGRADVNA